MLFFYVNTGQGGWQIGPLIALIPLVLQFAPFLLDLVPTVGFSQWRRSTTFGDAVANLVVAAAFNLAVPAIGVWGFVRFVRWVRQNGGWGFLLRLLLQGHQGGAAFGLGGGRGGVHWRGGHGGAAQRPPARRVTVEEVAEALSKLPTETYMTPEQLAALPVHELKALLHGRGLDPVKCLEKGELVRQLLQHGGSSADSCSICCEDYAPCEAAGASASAAAAAAGTAGGTQSGQEQQQAAGAAGAAAEAGAEAEAEPVVLRVLRCGHRFHVECVDKWFLSATDYTREPACPLCNAPLLQERPQQGQGQRHDPRR